MKTGGLAPSWTPAMPAAIAASDPRKTYASGLRALSGIGEIFALLGPNGAGFC